MDEDTELFLALKKGDKLAFSKLFQKYYPKIVNLIYRFLFNEKKDVEDLAQEIFCRAYFGARSFSPQAKFSTWLYKIAVNRCFSHYHKIKRRRESYQDDGQETQNFENHPSPINSPDTQIIQKELHQEIQAALDKLPPDHKMAFILLESAGLSYQEIARISGTSVKAVERRIYHARQKLKELLTPYISS
jgi:RNA polymerase sigma-70 factor (ECF subfamily)